MTWLVANWQQVLQLGLTHLALSIPPIFLSFLIAVPLGALAHHYRWSRGLILSVCGLLYAIPSLPLLVMLPAVIGTPLRSPVNVVIALTAYGVALMVRSATDGFADVGAEVRLAATAVGYSPLRRFFAVELPLAGPSLLAGIRVVVVSTVSLLTVSAVLGISSLGTLFTDGIQRGIDAEIITGIIATLVLAFFLDALCVLAGRLLMPWASRATRVGRDRRARREAVIAG